MTRADEVQTVAIQCVGEMARLLAIAEAEARAGQLTDCRDTLRACKVLIRLLDNCIPAATRPQR